MANYRWRVISLSLLIDCIAFIQPICATVCTLSFARLTVLGSFLALSVSYSKCSATVQNSLSILSRAISSTICFVAYRQPCGTAIPNLAFSCSPVTGSLRRQSAFTG